MCKQLLTPLPLCHSGLARLLLLCPVIQHSLGVHKNVSWYGLIPKPVVMRASRTPRTLAREVRTPPDTATVRYTSLAALAAAVVQRRAPVEAAGA